MLGLPVEIWALFISVITIVFYFIHRRPAVFLETSKDITNEKKLIYHIMIYNPKSQPIRIIVGYFIYAPNDVYIDGPQIRGFHVMPKDVKTIIIDSICGDEYLTQPVLERLWINKTSSLSEYLLKIYRLKKAEKD